MSAVRRFALRHHVPVLWGLVLVVVTFDEPVSGWAALLGLFVVGFAAGALTLGSEVAAELRATRRYIDWLEGVNRRLTSRFKRRREL